MAALLEYHVQAHRIDEHGSLAKTKDAAISLDTALSGRQDAFNPAELFLAAIAACMIKGIERVTPMLHFHLRGVDIALHAVRQDSPPQKTSRLIMRLPSTPTRMIVVSSCCIQMSENLGRSRIPLQLLPN